MAEQNQPDQQEVAPCLLSDYDDEIEAERESFQAFMTKQAEEHWVSVIDSMDIEGSVNTIVAVIEREVSKHTRRLEKISSAMAIETGRYQSHQLLGMIPSRENLLARLTDLALSRLLPAEASAEQPLTIDNAPSSTLGCPSENQVPGRESENYWQRNESPAKKRSDGPVKIQPPSPSKRRRVTQSVDESSSVIECSSPRGEITQSCNPSSSMIERSFQRGKQPDLAPGKPPQSFSSQPSFSAQHVAEKYGIQEKAHATRRSSRKKKSAQPLNPGHKLYSSLHAVNFYDIQGREWIFHFQGSGSWYILRCGFPETLEQGPGIGLTQEISAWVNSSNDIIRFRNMNRPRE
ncbi:hypothetical protein B0T21DRAFT_387869 [Apiosordaria backusii]|uniref:Uncharacterized protein n=1 Tax=Apiosordaria backusii TaxID=314023 RepID=A0AA39ZV52_9PEZI|nr:hypothetical protein B0T21DRAFT_387869 [Apiosordaria backusii]